MALSFTEGSIGADFERVPLGPLEAFYSGRGRAPGAASGDEEPRGSNGIAIAPAITQNGRALLLINPHTSFFFRSELQVTSGEGLNAYGAATWGQFFIYQGFNDRLGWTHTTSGLDVVDEFAERVSETNGRLTYRHGSAERPVETRSVTVAYRAADGSQARRTFQSYRTHHGPITREENGRWIATALMHRPVEALSQSFLRTKARNFAEFGRALEFRANSSNNTLYADADGNIAYLHPQFIPRRNDRLDYTRPVDGSDPSADWGELHALSEAPQVVNPANSWVMNTNNWPYSAAGANSPRAADFPRYMDTFGENPRGRHALLLLEGSSGWTLERLQAAAYDSYQPAFATMIPTLVAAFERQGRGRPAPLAMAEAIARLRGWDYRWGVDSVETSIAVFWAEALTDAVPERRARPGTSSPNISPSAPPTSKRSRRCARRSTASSASSAAGASPGARSTASSASPATSSRTSRTRLQASRSPSPAAPGARSPRSAHAHIPAPIAGTAPPATASSQSSSSALASARAPSARAGRAGTQARPISTTRRGATPPATCATSISTPISSGATPRGPTGPARQRRHRRDRRPKLMKLPRNARKNPLLSTEPRCGLRQRRSKASANRIRAHSPY
jgi:hypothetical protein